MKALEGLLVVAIEQAVAAPLCTARLVAAGARVIKIERDSGDFARGYDSAAKGESTYFTWLNQGKESVCLDFKDKTGSAILWSLLRKADVMIQNLAPGALARSGFHSDALHAENPELIICNISGYGNDGEAAEKPAYDLLVQAESGLISVSGSPGAPGRIGVSVCDIGAGVTAYGGILEALLRRSKTGKGEEFSVSLFDVAADWMAVPYMHAMFGNGAPKPVGLCHPSIAPYGAFKCNDNRLVLISIQNEREWKRLCEKVLFSHAIVSNPDYGSNNDRVANRSQLDADIGAIVSTLPSEEFEARLKSSGIAFGRINGPSDIATHPALRSQDYTTSCGESLSMPAHPLFWHADALPKPLRTPKLGEHTDAVIREFADKSM